MTALAASEPRSLSGQAGWVLIAGIVLAAITEAVASTVLSLGRGDIIGDTYATPDQFAWLDIGYTALKLMGFIAAPWFIARFNPRRLVLVSTLTMAAACLFAAFTVDLETLVALRVLQGFSGGILLVSGQTLLFLAYPRSQQPFVQALFAMGSVVAPATLAPALQGWLLDNRSWTWIFFANAPIAIAAAGFLLMANERSLPPLPRRPFDLLGFVLLSGSLACVAYRIRYGLQRHCFALRCGRAVAHRHQDRSLPRGKGAPRAVLKIGRNSAWTMKALSGLRTDAYSAATCCEG